MTTRLHHYEIWVTTPTHADVTGDSDSLWGALVLYARSRRASRGHTVNLLVSDLPRPKARDACRVAAGPSPFPDLAGE